MQKPARCWTISADPSSLLVLTNGYQSWSDSELRPLTDTPLHASLPWMIDQGQDPLFPPFGQAGVWRSHGLIALIRPDGGGWVGCALDLTRSFAHWEARIEADRLWQVVAGEVDPRSSGSRWPELQATCCTTAFQLCSAILRKDRRS